ncbi:MAG: hypothetical protein MJA30_06145 [Cytophagales bacterium]|nr:hypothetical protein [Cytophagales bacterium]
MQKITVTVKDDSKVNFFMELIQQFDFIEVQPAKEKRRDTYNFFDSAGLWKDRDITGDQLRQQAWKRGS